MRLHHLEISAFGPFAGRIDINLDAVAAGGLFLIRGATGAGKTSLLDAVCFALFADVPGARTKKGLHSDHADRSEVPQVTLEFTAARRRLRIERSPEFMRPKTRGTGEIKVPAKAVLWEHRDGSWHALSTRHDEIAEVVHDVLGLGMEQFSKVVLLPQGDFAAFLRATPEERRSLLERLFDVATYAGIEDWFALRRKDSGAVLDAERGALAADLSVLAEVLAGGPAELGVDSPEWAALPAETLPTALETVRRRVDSAVAGAMADLDAARLSDTAATAAHAQGAQLAALQRRRAEAQQRLALLEQERPLHQEALLRLAAAERAASVRGDLTAIDRADGALAAASALVAGARHGVIELGIELDDHTAERLGRVLDELATGATSLADAARLEDAVADRARRRDGAAERLSQATVRHRELTAQAQDTAAAHLEVSQALHHASTAAASVQSARSTVDRLTTLDRLRREQDHADTEAVQLRQQLSTTRQRAQDLRQAYQDLRQGRLDGMAAELAARLDHDGPCPVCGSTVHPTPAAVSRPVTAEAVDDAELSWRAADESTSTLLQSLAAVEAATSQRMAQLAVDDRSAALIAAALQDARTALSSLDQLAASLPTLRERAESAAESVALLDQACTQSRDEVAAAGAALAVGEDDLATQVAQLHEALTRHAGCPCAQGAPSPSAAAELPSADALRMIHEALSGAVVAYADANARRAAAETAREHVWSDTQRALDAAGFESVAQAREAQLAAPALSDLRADIAAYADAVAGARSAVADPEVQAAQADPAPDLGALALARDQARVGLLAATSADTLLRRTLDGLDRVRGGLIARCKAIEEVRTEHELVRELADTLGGTGAANTLRMRLSAFVLAARLEKVAALANERLAAMGEGRYQLRHTDGLAARGARSGLGLEVLDLWTGQARETTSLSGGESFMASLALALGLADAVREEAGGFDLQTLFIDEGFGSLDDESLEQVMEVLDALREGGRAVGVVSHVAELRTRIPTQVVVDKTERGSTVRVTGAETDAAPAA